MRARAWAASLVALLMVGCAGAAPTPSAIGTAPATPTPLPSSAPTAVPSPTQPPTPAVPATPTARPSTAETDLDNLLVRLEQIHPEPFHAISREEWVAQLEELKTSLPTLTPEEAMVGLMRLVALLSRDGRDGHQFALPLQDEMLPLATYEFAEGTFITAALGSHSDLVGTEIVAVEGHPIADVQAALEPLVPRDGPATVPAFRPIFFARFTVLRGLGLAGDGPLTMTVRDTDGAETEVALEPISIDEYVDLVGQYGVQLPSNEALYLSRPGPLFWKERIAGRRVLYIRYEQVVGMSSSLLDEIALDLADPRVERVVVDLRQNPGGDNHNFPSLRQMLAGYSGTNPGRLVVLTDRRTFSAASNFATALEQTTDATFAGEAMGGGLNFWNDVTQVQLPNYPLAMQVGVSTRYWEYSTPDDPRLTIEPDLSFAVTAADYFAGRDPVMEAILDLSD